MKKNLKTLTLACLVILAACSEDDTAAINEISLNEDIEQLESTPLAAQDVSENVDIIGSTREEGLPPTPNEAISLDISNSSTVGLLNEGFEISLNSDAAISGAYLVFKGTDGSVANDYYDIDLNANTSFFKSQKAHMEKDGLLFHKSSRTEEETVEIGFNNTIEPGTFCYEICVYDEEGNISAPQELCVTVQSWGGSDSLVGNWKFVREEISENGQTAILEAGLNDCVEATFECTDGSMLSYEYCSVFTADLEFKNDGSYYFKSEGTEKYLDANTTFNQCEVNYINDDFSSDSLGNWAYASNEKRLTLVEYEYSYTEAGETETYTLEPGEGDLIFDGVAEIVDGQLVISSDETYTIGDESFTITYQIYFEK